MTKKTKKQDRYAKLLDTAATSIKASVTERFSSEVERLRGYVDTEIEGVREAFKAFADVVNNLGWPMISESKPVDFLQGGTIHLFRNYYEGRAVSGLRLENMQFRGDSLSESHYIDGSTAQALAGSLVTGKREMKPGKYRWVLAMVRVEDEDEEK